MGNLEIKEKLIADLAKIDGAIAKPMAVASIAILGAATACLLAHMIFDAPTAFISTTLTAVSISINVASRYSNDKARKIILEMHGLKCGNCNKTPQPATIHRGFPTGFCPHRQLQYSAER